MLLKYLFNALIFSSFFNNFFLWPLNASVGKNIENREFQIDINYLNKLPENDYILGPGDLIQILVSRDLPELNNKIMIDGEGTIYTPFLNRIYVEGLTINELNQILNKAYEKYVRYPNVEVQVIKYRPIRIFIEGEVENPGLITLEGSFELGSLNNEVAIATEAKSFKSENVSYFPTVFDAIRKSGGITQFSDLSNVQLIRKNRLSNGGGKKSTNLDFENILLTGDNTQNIRVYDSDVIKIRKNKNPNKALLTKAILSNINSKFINVFVTGRVNNPGNIRISRAATLNDAIDLSGGAKVLKGPLTFIRYNNDGSIDKRRFGLKRRAKRGSYKNPYLRQGDMLFVGVSPLNVINEITTEITEPFVGIFSTYSIIKEIRD